MRGYVPIFFDWLECTQDLTQEEKGNLIDAVMLYATGQEYEPVLTGNEKIAFRFMRGQIDRNNEISETRAKAGARKREQTETKANKTEQKEANENKRKQKQTKAEAGRRFETFWNAYPKKTAKESARKAFEKIGVDDALLGVMLDAIKKQAEGTQWQEAGGQFIPYPATWLNGRRWEDQPGEPAVRKGTVSAQNYEQRIYEEEHELPEDMLKRISAGL